MSRSVVAFIAVSLVSLLVLGCMDDDDILNRSKLIQGNNISHLINMGENKTVDLEIHPNIEDTIELGKKYYMAEGEKKDARIDRFDFIFEVVEVSMRKGITIKVNSKKYEGLKPGKYVEMTDGVVVNILDALYNDPNEGKKSVVFLSFEKRKVERYPDILIEKDIGDFEYQESFMKLANLTGLGEVLKVKQYQAIYKGAKVSILQGEEKLLPVWFSRTFVDPANLKKEDGEYILLQKRSTYAAWLSAKAAVLISLDEEMDYDEVEPLISAYVNQYKSILDKDYNCRQRFTILEKQSVIVDVDGRNFEVENYAVSDTTGRVKLKVDGDFLDTLDVGQYFLLGNLPVILYDVEVYSDGNSDEAMFCRP